VTGNVPVDKDKDFFKNFANKALKDFRNEPPPCVVFTQFYPHLRTLSMMIKSKNNEKDDVSNSKSEIWKKRSLM